MSTVHDFRENEGREARDARILKELSAIVAHAYDSSAEFAARMDAAGLSPDAVTDFDSFAAIPPLRKKDLSVLQKEKGLEWFLSCKPGELRRIYQSPGPLFDPEGREADYWGWAEAFHAAGFRSGDLVQMTFSYHLTPAGLMLEEPLHELGCAVIPAGPGNTEVQLDLLSGLPVTGFVGMTSYLKVIGQKALENGLDPQKDLNLRVGFVVAERLPESLRAEVEAMFGMSIRQGYGTADLGCIAYECSELDGMHLSSRCHVEICDPSTGAPLPVGEVGEVVVTPFTRAYPLVRLATGDLSRLVDEPCSCGRTAPRLAGILGRADDTAKVKGQFVYPSQVAQALAPFKEIERHQVAVDNDGGRDNLTLVVQAPGGADEEALRSAFRAVVKLNPAIRVLPSGESLPENAPALVDRRKYE